MQKTLITGCGKRAVKEEGKVNLDIRAFDGVDVVHDLNKPFPFKDNSFIHVSAIHVVEHLQDLIHFMDECWRVLAPGGTLYIETPLAGGDPDLEFCDPTHVRCYRPHTFVNYFLPEGVEKFGYTDKPWALIKIDCQHNVLIFDGTPIKL